ncbi:MAG TPA: sigma-70 family RNA polymerase sigma factor [Solirubrobacteraceae bacterium]|nr:sigma-70 family RNA polymerase sigma factor [Solirubrobacteraceae bacterium]
MSPLRLRKDRAERLLREQFEGLRGQVLASVRGRLRASGVSLDRADLEAAYAQAWQGMYAAVLDGQRIESQVGWLVLVTYRRALDEHRARTRARCGGEPQARNGGAGTSERDLATELDDRARLRQLFEGLRGRLDAREREAATLCYLHGLSRAQAAQRMGVSERRMRKLMEGRGAGQPGVAGKVGALVDTIRGERWCEQQGSLMRALAYGVLDPAGERYRLALAHSDRCPACRAYVVSLRGLAVALPPVFLPWSVCATVLADVAEGVRAGGLSGPARAVGTARSAGSGSGGAPGGAGSAVQAGRGLGGALPGAGAGAAAGGAAGGGWALGAGSFGAKLAAGCLLALGVGAGCVALEGGHRASAPSRHARRAVAPAARGTGAATLAYGASASAGQAVGDGALASGAGGAAALTPAARAEREFGPEQLSTGSGAAADSHARATARSASSSSARTQPGEAQAASAGVADGASAGAEGQPGGGRSAAAGTQPPGNESSGGAGSDSAAAEREFSPG